jgi:hypothetical protein
VRFSGSTSCGSLEQIKLHHERRDPAVCGHFILLYANLRYKKQIENPSLKSWISSLQQAVLIS